MSIQGCGYSDFSNCICEPCRCNILQSYNSGPCIQDSSYSLCDIDIFPSIRGSPFDFARLDPHKIIKPWGCSAYNHLKHPIDGWILLEKTFCVNVPIYGSILIGSQHYIYIYISIYKIYNKNKNRSTCRMARCWLQCKRVESPQRAFPHSGSVTQK